MVKFVNEMNTSFLSKSNNESFARVVVSAFIAQLDPTIDELTDIKTAVSEAVTNSIVHGYKSEIGIIYINSRIYENGKILVKIRDKGCGIKDISQAMEPLFTTGGSERSGLGFAVMQSFMDKIKVNSKINKGTAVILEKYIIRRNICKND
ncbi:MAG: anti-sigma F factor [Candidatus Paraimprobicoccus trichonymphae]|uniref:Anti-sigma F factor n=1 Tax=Candidatus Paraimprobicoccus trichonymphae TaxID=3033793 RepID=A0AA48IH75_9FIRM|nr:MAG: anti-sigma F factor [Candidatus Paraimprobicoccus trichonymphae]